MRLLIISLLFSILLCPVISAKKEVRLTKKEKNELMELCMNFSRLERSVYNLQDIANNIQNSMVSINVGNKEDCCKEINKKIDELKEQLKHIYELLIIEKQILGHLDDESVSSDFFMSPDDIDAAELSIISWLKSIYRRQLEDDHYIS